MPGVDYGVVVNDDNTVVGRVHVELDGIGSQLNGSLEGGERVLGMRLVRSPVGDSLRRIPVSTWGQAFLAVVALCWMREAMNTGGRGQSALTAGGAERLPVEAP